MLVVEAKLKNGTPEQYQRLDEAIRTSQFVRTLVFVIVWTIRGQPAMISKNFVRY
ncbi:hypothetical protein H6G48_12810 [Microcystis flos-aquae FACHB-1344]|uniref:Uncharacterized protein n=1 Tax=Microcystis flos-aquae FACHB-1344 TaxID=2692899 RepID=A0ABR8HTJ3_9CHRO|nr:hypothetical protein [Microcystis flos-aquae FACHB-1344]